jgi:Na+/serine symporter
VKETLVEEIFPITAGLICGLLLGSLTARRRLAVGLVVSILVGALATVVSGEWRITWAFLLIDIPLAAGCAAVGSLTSRALVLRISTRQWTL